MTRRPSSLRNRSAVVAFFAALFVMVAFPLASWGQPHAPDGGVRENAGMVLPEHEPYGTDHSLGGTLRGYYGRFARVNPYKQVGWITTYSLVLLLILVLLGGYPLREFGKAALLTVPGSALIALTPLQPWLRLHPLLGVAGVCFVMILALRAFSGPAKHQEFRQLVLACLIVVTLAWLPTRAARGLVRMIFDAPAPGAAVVPPAGGARIAASFALLATGLFVAFVGLAAWRFEQLDREGVRRFGRPLLGLWAGMLAVGVPLVLFVERVGEWRLRVDAEGRWLEGFRFGPEIIMVLASVVPLLVAVAMFRGPSDRRRVLRYAGAVGAVYVLVMVAWRLARG